MNYTEDGNETQVKSCQDKSPAQCSLCVTEYIILNLMHIRKVTENDFEINFQNISKRAKLTWECDYKVLGMKEALMM